MGCACIRSSKLEFVENMKSIENIKEKPKFLKTNLIKIENNILNKILYMNKISKNLWMKVVDFMAFKDLKEVAKTNRIFFNISRSFQILTKFFKNKSVKINGVYNKNSNSTMNINNNFILINQHPAKTMDNSSISSIPSFHKSSFFKSGKLYFSSNNNSSSNGSIYSLQKTLNNLKNLKASSNINNSIDFLNDLDNNLIKFFEANPGLYKDFFNKTEIDMSKIKNEISRSSSINKTPTFSSIVLSDNEKFINSLLEQTVNKNKNNFSRFITNNKDLNVIYEENNKNGMNRKNEINDKYDSNSNNED